MENIINEILHHRDVYCSDLNDIWEEMWEMLKDTKSTPLLKLQEHYNQALNKKNISEILIYLKELVYYIKQES